jgi:hypothetical protein
MLSLSDGSQPLDGAPVIRIGWLTGLVGRAEINSRPPCY